MKKEVEEENKAKKHRLMATSPDWLDLPEAIVTNIILEHLDVVDYIRFPAVCKKWQSIQKEHRILYSPSPPPSPLPFPWLVCSHCLESLDDMAFHFYRPDKQKSYSIPPWKGPYRVNSLGYAYGWLLLLLKFDPYGQSLCIVNPITGVQIMLRLLRSRYCAIHITSQPIDPDCTVVTFDYDDHVHFYRLNENSSTLMKPGYSIINGCRPFVCHSKVYYMAHYKKIFMVDALLRSPGYKAIEMDYSDIYVDFNPNNFHLLDFLGELVMVIVVYEEFVENDYDTIKEFHVYKADFSVKKWVRMESLGDHALFFSKHIIFSLPAVDVGFKKNAIYSAGGLKGHGVAWRAFDVSTKVWIDGPGMSLPTNKCKCHSSNGKWSWFLPTLDYYNVSKRNEAWRVLFRRTVSS